MMSGDLSEALLKIRRDGRIDVLRGFALLCIYVDHIPRDVLNWATLHNFGFSDAAELFVMFAGFASMVAYGRIFALGGALVGLRRIIRRCVRLYVFQLGLLLIALGTVWACEICYGFIPRKLAPMLQNGIWSVIDALTLTLQPSYLDILPLYIVLLALFPLVYLGLRTNLVLTVLVSATVWLVADFYPSLNFTNSLTGKGWFFDPFSWQFIFVLGATLAIAIRRGAGDLPRWPWLVILCYIFLIWSFFEAFRWTDWGLPNLAPFSVALPDKTHLDVLRLLHAAALVYVMLTWRRWTRSSRSLVVYCLEACGRHSLEVFSLGTVLSLFGRLALRVYGDGWDMQAIVNLVGIGGMVSLGVLLEHIRKQPPLSPPSAKAYARMSPLERSPYSPNWLASKCGLRFDLKDGPRIQGTADLRSRPRFCVRELPRRVRLGRGVGRLPDLSRSVSSALCAGFGGFRRRTAHAAARRVPISARTPLSRRPT